ncbi:MAG: type II toxin-antitoxin system VapC family toxin [Anaerolineae bacterium]|nr:type II toxin-antitoxin system VapC family toxin [Anaerolineae bacterium]
MTLYILDTDHVSLHQRGDQAVLARLQTRADDTVCVTIITVEEQLRGRLAQLGQAGAKLSFVYDLLQATSAYFCGIPVLPFDPRAQETYQQLLAQKVRIGSLDLRIAAITLTQNGILVTRNRRDFERVPGLSLEDWSH